MPVLTVALVTCTDNTGPEPARVKPAPTPSATSNPPAIFVGAGDISSCSKTGDSQTADLLDDIPGTVFLLGDNAYENGTTSEFQNCYGPTWGRHKDRTRPSAGNVDYNSSGATPYYNYFGAAAGEPGRGYYSFDLGAWHIVVLNSNISRTSSSPQVQWLREDLEAHPNRCTLAYWHHPFYSSVSGTGSGGAIWPSLRPIWDALYEAGAELVLNGHRHVYERLAPLKPDGTRDNDFGIRTIIAGTGGRSGGTLTNLHPASEVRNGSSFGVLKLYLYDDSYAWKFVPVAGKTFSDSGSVSCHFAPGSGGGGGVSASLSTVSASPTSITATSGSSTSTIAVTAKDANGDPVSGASVLLSATGSGNTLTQPSPTNANGVATGTIASSAAGTKTITAQVNGLTINQTANVTVVAGATSGTESTLAASPAAIAAGTGTSTITATVKDQFGNPVSGATVTFDATGTGNTLTQPSGPTNTAGVATGSLRSTDVGEKVVSATADGSPISQTQTVTVLPPGGATIEHTLLASGNNSTNQLVYTTASVSPKANTLITLAVLGHRAASAAPAVPSVSGGGMTTWTQVATITFDTVQTLTHKRLTIFRATSSSPGSGPITITFKVTLSSAQWIVSQWDGADVSGANASAAIAQVVSERADAAGGLNASLAPFGGANNVSLGVVGLDARTPVVTPGGGFSEIAEHASDERVQSDLEAAWASGDNTIDPTWSGQFNAGLIGLELRAAGSP